MAKIISFNAQKFFSDLKPFFHSNGYEFAPAHNMFCKADTSGYSAIFIYPSVYPDEISFDIRISSRIHIVEQTLRCFLPIESDFSNLSTVNIPIETLWNGTSGILTAKKPKEVEKVMRNLFFYLNEGGFKFLNKLVRLDYLNFKLNDLPHARSEYFPDNIERCFRGVIVAYLSKDPDWSDIHKAYLHYLENNAKVSPEIFQAYMRLISFLEAFGLN